MMRHSLVFIKRGRGKRLGRYFKPPPTMARVGKGGKKWETYGKKEKVGLH